MRYETLANIEVALRQFGPQLVEEFSKALPAIQGRLGTRETRLWAEEGMTIAGQGAGAWEAAAQYFRASPMMPPSVDWPQLLAWAQAGRELAQASSDLASAYFLTSPEVCLRLAGSPWADWANEGRRLYKGTWQSRALACRFFELGPQLVGHAGPTGTRLLSRFLELLAAADHNLATESLESAPKVLGQVDSKCLDAFLDFSSLQAQASPRQARACFEVVGPALARICQEERLRFLQLAGAVARTHPFEGAGLFPDGARSLGSVHVSLHGKLLSLAQDLVAVHPVAAVEFIRNCSLVLSRLRPKEMEAWVKEGRAIFQDSPAALVSYFRLESRRSQEIMERLASQVELRQVASQMQMYGRALTGQAVLTLPTVDPGGNGPGQPASTQSTGEGYAVYLPPVLDRYLEKEENYLWAKVAVTHQVAHLEFGSFDFDFDRPSCLFADLRPGMKPAVPAREQLVTDFQQFFDLFPERKLAVEAFIALEDARLDHRVKRRYRGLRAFYERAQRDALEDRPDIFGMPLREAILENLVRLGLGQTTGLSIPRAARAHMLEAAHLQAAVMTLDATVEDSAEATARLYGILSLVPNVLVPGELWEAVPGSLTNSLPPAADVPGPAMVEAAELAGGEERQMSPIPEVDFRGQFRPELAQVVVESDQGKSPDPDQKAVEESDDTCQTKNPALVRLNPEMANDRAQRQKPGPRRNGSDDGAGGESLEDDEPTATLYDEWDFHAGDYKPRWCRVWQRVLEEGSADFYERTLQEHRNLASQVQRQFEAMSAELLRKVKGLPDGEEFELDAVIEAMVDRRAGQTPSDKLYWRRAKVERDVAVAFLLDMSGSTALGVEDTETYVGNRGLRNLRRIQSEPVRPRSANKRIVDIEKESAVLLIKALEATHDVYGIYGFSGAGRENVEFYVIKDLNETFSEAIKRRLDNVAPLQATRMGPAIRHAISKLERQGARTRILFLLSDGQPQDQGYGRDGGESQYALHDTRMALLEARQKGIVPFCLTVDKAGHDYLGTMCADMGYEVVDDIYSLPKRLPALYRSLTT